MIEQYIQQMDLYIRFMICIISTTFMLIALKTLLDKPIYKAKRSFQKKSFRNKINVGRFTNKELLIIKDEVEQALRIDGYINKHEEE